MNLKNILILLTGILITYGSLKGQSVAFLEVSPDARATALGGAGTALSPDAWSVFWNVAKAAKAESKMAFAYSYSPWMEDYRENSQLHRMGTYYRLSSKDAIVAGFRHFSNGKFEIIGADGISNGEINPSEYALELGYSRNLCESLSAGVTMRYISSNMGALQGADAAGAIAFDLGLYYKAKVSLFSQKSDISLGLTASDIGSRIEYDESKYALPTRVSAGGSLTFVVGEQHSLECVANATYRLLPSDSRVLDGGVGLEYGLYEIGFLRAGYRWADIEKNIGGDYFSFGVGAKYWHLLADASWRLSTEDYDPLDKTFTFSVGVNF